MTTDERPGRGRQGTVTLSKQNHASEQRNWMRVCLIRGAAEEGLNLK